MYAYIYMKTELDFHAFDIQEQKKYSTYTYIVRIFFINEKVLEIH